MLPWSINVIRWFIKTYLDKPIQILQFVSCGKIPKFLKSLETKYFRILDNKPPGSWVAHITRDFITCYSSSYYSFMLASTAPGTQGLNHLLGGQGKCESLIWMLLHMKAGWWEVPGSGILPNQPAWLKCKWKENN